MNGKKVICEYVYIYQVSICDIVEVDQVGEPRII